MIRLSGPFAQLLRYAAPADARSTTVRLRSAGTASLAFERKSSLNLGKNGGKKRQKKAKKEQVLRKKAEKLKQKRKNDYILRLNTYKISHPIQKHLSMLKWVVLNGGKFCAQDEED